MSVIRSVIPSLLAAAALASPGLAQSSPAARDRILALRDSSNAIFDAMRGGASGPVMVSPDLLGKLRALDATTTAGLKEIITKQGWPGKSAVGAEAAGAAAKLIGQIHDLQLQERALALMEKAGAAEVAPLDLARLTDQVRVASGRPQVYGTVSRLNQYGEITVPTIADSASVDARRRLVGLGPLADSLKAIKAPVLPGGVQVVRPDTMSRR